MRKRGIESCSCAAIDWRNGSRPASSRCREAGQWPALRIDFRSRSYAAPQPQRQLFPVAVWMPRSLSALTTHRCDRPLTSTLDRVGLQFETHVANSVVAE
jgi:hypothetical protein